MKLVTFIMDNKDLLFHEWGCMVQHNVGQTKPSSHIKDILNTIAIELMPNPIKQPHTAAKKHGVLRMEQGFSVSELAAEYRAFRSNVMKHWKVMHNTIRQSDLDDIILFNDAIDHSLHESIASYLVSKEKQTRQLDAKRRLSEEKIWQTAHYDDLTGLPNRRLFRDRLDQAIKHAKRTDKLFALLSIDLDRFKEVNDRLGHGAGDALLKKAGQRIKACVRETDTVARMGGDEFSIVLTNITHASHAEIVTTKIVHKLAKSFQVEKQSVCISASIGIALYPLHGRDSSLLQSHADSAMYVAKQSGRNQFSMHEQTLERQ